MTVPKTEDFRQVAHQLTDPAFDTPGELVAWMGAVQAQDYAMAQWAVGIRLKAATQGSVREAFYSRCVS